jgi:hypothetical protein
VNGRKTVSFKGTKTSEANYVSKFTAGFSFSATSINSLRRAELSEIVTCFNLFVARMDQIIIRDKR